MFLKNIFKFLLSIVILIAPVAADTNPPLIPWPKSVVKHLALYKLTASSKMIYEDSTLDKLVNLVAEEIFMLTGIKPVIQKNGIAVEGDILLKFDHSLNESSYSLNVGSFILLRAGSYQAMAFGTSTLLQSFQLQNDKVLITKMLVEDSPKESFRSVLLDIAREPYSLDSIKKQIVLNRFYKIPYLVLHLNDDQGCCFKLDFDPTYGTTNFNGSKDRRLIPSYTKQQLRELVDFAQVRGVTIIPEIEMPGHGASLIRARPDLYKTGEYHHATLNIANPAAIDALKQIVFELSEVFSNSLYIYLGGDEADFAKLNRGVPTTHIDSNGNVIHDVYENVRQQWDNKLDELTEREIAAGRLAPGAIISDAHAVFRDFVNQMDDFVMSLGKRAVIWESWTIRDPVVPVNRDIVVMPYDQFVPATVYINSGFTLINSSWSPLYIVGVNSIDGSGGLEDTQQNIYNWNKRFFDVYYGNQTPTSKHVVSTALSYAILGGQLSLWENTELGFLPAERSRLPAMAEKLWNPDKNDSYDNFTKRFRKLDTLLDSVITANFVTPANATNPIQTAAYTSFNGQKYTMKVMQGKYIALQIQESKFSNYNQAILQKIINVYDNAYTFYLLATGKKPQPFIQYNGKLSMAVVDSTCGSGCGYLGSTGIELDSGMWEIVYNNVKNNNQFEQVSFYELGRNFWHYGYQLNGGNPNGPTIGQYSFTTGFAVYMRFKSMEYAKIVGAPFGSYNFPDFVQAVKNLVDIYEGNPSFTFENTILIGKSPGFGSGTDLFASFLFRLERDYGGSAFVYNFWKNVGRLPIATTDAQAIDNFFIAACRTAGQNLTNLFVNKWRWPVSLAALQEAQNL